MKSETVQKLQRRFDDLSQTIHPHPTLSETVMEAAEGFATPAARLERRDAT